jgi:hypothetical protein
MLSPSHVPFLIKSITIDDFEKVYEMNRLPNTVNPERACKWKSQYNKASPYRISSICLQAIDIEGIRYI